MQIFWRRLQLPEKHTNWAFGRFLYFLFLGKSFLKQLMIERKTYVGFKRQSDENSLNSQAAINQQLESSSGNRCILGGHQQVKIEYATDLSPHEYISAELMGIGGSANRATLSRLSPFRDVMSLLSDHRFCFCSVDGFHFCPM